MCPTLGNVREPEIRETGKLSKNAFITVIRAVIPDLGGRCPEIGESRRWGRNKSRGGEKVRWSQDMHEIWHCSHWGGRTGALLAHSRSAPHSVRILRRAKGYLQKSGKVPIQRSQKCRFSVILWFSWMKSRRMEDSRKVGEPLKIELTVYCSDATSIYDISQLSDSKGWVMPSIPNSIPNNGWWKYFNWLQRAAAGFFA
jgi:hypothetical protein